MNKNNTSQVKSSEVKSNQIKSYTHMMIRIRIRIIDGRKLRIIIRVNIIITTTLKTIRLARMIMRMADKSDNENDQRNESDRSKHNNDNKVKNN